MKYNIRLSIKAIVRAEQFLSKSFTDIDYSNQDEVLKLLYCAILTNNSETFTFEEFLNIIDNDIQLSIMIKELEKVNLILSQFVTPGTKSLDVSSGETHYIKDLIGLLIMAGLDANYVMNEMELSDIPIYAEAYERKKREEMEANRLWTFLSAAPHIDTTKIRSAEDFFAFPWELEARKKKAHESINRDTDTLECFFKEGMNLFKNN